MNNGTTYPYELPKGWVWTRLGGVLGFVKGKKPKNLGTRNNLLTIPYININAFENEIFDEFTDGDKCPLCQTDNILIVWDGARCGLVGRGVAGAIGSTLAKLPCFEVNSTYAFYFLQSMYEFINKRPRGVGIPHVDPSVFWNIPVPLSPLPEQHRIVAKIEELFTKLDAGVESLKKIKTQLKRYRQSVLKHAFEGRLTEEWRQAHKDELEPASILLERIKQERHKTVKGKHKELPPLDTSALPELPESWVWTRVGELFDISYGLSESLSKTEADTQADVPVIRIPNITEFGSLDLTQLKYFPLAKAKRENLAINRGDVLFNWRNAPKWIGRSAVFDRDGEFVNASFLLKLRPCLQGYSHFASYYLNHLRINGYFLTKVSNAVNQANFNATMTARVEIPFPAILEQHRIVEEIERRFSVADQIEKTVNQSLKQAERLRQSILKRTFEGKLVPQAPNDEPAEKILERIEAQRTKHLTEAKATSTSKKKTTTKQMGLV